MRLILRCIGLAIGVILYVTLGCGMLLGIGWLFFTIARFLGIDPEIYSAAYIPIGILSVIMVIAPLGALKHLRNGNLFIRHFAANCVILLYGIPIVVAVGFVGICVVFSVSLFIAGAFGLESKSGIGLLITFASAGICMSVGVWVWEKLSLPVFSRLSHWAERS